MASLNVIWMLTAGLITMVSTDQPSYHVTLHIFSGVPDPEWVVDSPSSGYTFLSQNVPALSTQLASRLGYSGFSIDKYQGLFDYYNQIRQIINDMEKNGSHKLSNVTVGRCREQLFEGELLNIIGSLTPVGYVSPLSPSLVQKVSQDIAGC